MSITQDALHLWPPQNAGIKTLPKARKAFLNGLSFTTPEGNYVNLADICYRPALVHLHANGGRRKCWKVRVK